MSYKSVLLQRPNIIHGFFGRRGGVSTSFFSSLNLAIKPGESLHNIEANKSIACETLGLKVEHLRMVKQVHSNIVHNCDTADSSIGVEADAMITSRPHVALGIQTADCAPILLADSRHKVIGALHAGWRGALDGIIENTIDAMVVGGAARDLIVAVIGPTIRQETYEVDRKFRENFLSKKKGSEAFFKAGNDSNDRFLFDLPGFCISVLKEHGIKQVEDMRLNTYTNPEEFFSFRRMTHRGERGCGGQLSVIAMH